MAGLASLANFRKPGVYERVRTIGGSLMTGLADLVEEDRCGRAGGGRADRLRYRLHRQAGHRLPRRHDREWRRAPRRFNEVCLRNGVLKGGSKIYVSIVHDEADVARTLTLFGQALEAAARV